MWLWQVRCGLDACRITGLPPEGRGCERTASQRPAAGGEGRGDATRLTTIHAWWWAEVRFRKNGSARFGERDFQDDSLGFWTNACTWVSEMSLFSTKRNVFLFCICLYWISSICMMSINIYKLSIYNYIYIYPPICNNIWYVFPSGMDIS